MSPAFKVNSEHNIEWIKARPIAHRGLHDAKAGIYENTLGAAKAAVDNKYNIEIDLHISSDGVPMVFHDLTLDRLTAETGSVRERTAKELQQISIMGTEDRIPTLEAFFDLVAGKVSVVLELKGHDDETKDEGFVKAVSDVLSRYNGNAALMSFNHHLVKDAHDIVPHLPLGLTAYKDDSAYDQHMEIATACNVDFISYELKNLDTKFVREFKNTGRPVISWTVKSKEDHAFSDKFADQPTFEGFRP